MEETKQEFFVRRSVMNNLLELPITNYLFNESNMDYCYYCSSVALSSIPGAVKYVGESGPGAGCWLVVVVSWPLIIDCIIILIRLLLTSTNYNYTCYRAAAIQHRVSRVCQNFSLMRTCPGPPCPGPAEEWDLDCTVSNLPTIFSMYDLNVGVQSVSCGEN